MIIPIIIFIIVLAAKIAIDYKKWLSAKLINHSLEWVIMAIAYFPAIYLLSNHVSIPLPLSLLLSSVIVAWMHWLLFDGIFNIIRGLNWWYTGSGNGAKTDSLLKDISLWQGIVLKIIPLASFIYLYIKNFA